MEYEERRSSESDRAAQGIDGGDEASDGSGTIVESTNTEWTDEKHSLYLTSIEESFVNQLYNHDCHLNASHGWLRRTQKDSQTSELNVNHLCSGQFKVQRRGCWEQLKFERVRPQTGNRNESCMLSSNPWIKHFKPPNMFKGSPNTGCQTDNRTISEALPSPKQLFSGSRNVHHQKSVACDTEVSDQNFTDSIMEVEKKPSRTCRHQRIKIDGAFVSGRDQIVPFMSSSMSPSKENYSSLKRKRQ